MICSVDKSEEIYDREIREKKKKNEWIKIDTISIFIFPLNINQEWISHLCQLPTLQKTTHHYSQYPPRIFTQLKSALSRNPHASTKSSAPSLFQLARSPYSWFPVWLQFHVPTHSTTHPSLIIDLSSTLNPAPEYTGQPWTPMESFISMRTRPYASLTFEKPSLSRRTVIPGDTSVSFVVILCATYMFLVILALLYLVFVYEAPDMDRKGNKSDSEDSESEESDADSKNETLRMYKQMVKNKRQSLRTRRSDWSRCWSSSIVTVVYVLAKIDLIDS